MTGRESDEARRRRHNSSPSMRGMMMSRITRSGIAEENDSQASAPSAYTAVR